MLRMGWTEVQLNVEYSDKGGFNLKCICYGKNVPKTTTRKEIAGKTKIPYVVSIHEVLVLRRKSIVTNELGKFQA